MYWRAGIEQKDRMAGPVWVGRGGKVGSDGGVRKAQSRLGGQQDSATIHMDARCTVTEAQEDGGDGERPGTSGGSFRTRGGRRQERKEVGGT